jgi:hypothetical protein
MKKFILSSSLVAFAFGSAIAQVRPVGDDDTSPRVVDVPSNIAAKYQGGMFGYKNEEKGKLTFDDVNERLVFHGKDGKEKFSIPYKTLTMVYPNHQKTTSTTGKVLSRAPVPGAGLFGLLNEKRRFLIIEFEDDEVDMLGKVNFRIDDTKTLDAVIHALGAKGKLKQRGDAYYRGKPGR